MASASAALGDDAMASAASGAASGASGFLLGDDAVEFMQQRGEQTWEAANEAGGCEAVWLDDCAQCGDGGGLRACCGFCNHVFHPQCLDPPQDDVENWDDVAFACGLCVAEARAKPAITTQTQGARLMRQMRQQRATTAAAEARRAARDKDIRDEHDAIALFVEQRAGGAAAGKRGAPRGGGSSGGSNYASRPSELAELDAIEYVAKYATKTKLADYATDCTLPAAGAAAAAAAAASEGGRCFTLDKECPLAAHAAAAVAVTAPLGAPGNERVECDGCSHVRWDYMYRLKYYAKYVTKPVAGACNTAAPAACEDGDDMPALVSASDSDSE